MIEWDIAIAYSHVGPSNTAESLPPIHTPLSGTSSSTQSSAATTASHKTELLVNNNQHCGVFDKVGQCTVFSR